MSRSIRGVLSCLLLVIVIACSSDDPTEPPSGAPAGQPAAVSDLAVTAATDASITLNWTTPGVLGDDRALAEYDLRRAPFGSEPADRDDWTVVSLPAPDTPGTAASVTVDGLAAGSTWVFRLRSRGTGAWSADAAPVVATADPQWDQTPPAAITDLGLRWRGNDDLLVTWTATGDDGDYGEAAGYEVRHAEDPLDDGTWADATAGPAPVFDENLGLWTCQLSDLDPDATVHTAVRARDQAENWSDLSNGIASEPPTGTVWHVRVDGTGTVPTIAAAIEQASEGDLVLVHPGRYTPTNQGGAMDEKGFLFVSRYTTLFTVASAMGPEATILDAERQTRVIFMEGNNDEGLLIEGFTVTGGVSTDFDGEWPKAGGMTFHLTSTTVRDCIFEDNTGDEQGGAVYFGGVGTPTFERCVFRNNHVGGEFGGGGAVFAVNVHGYQDAFHGISFLDCVFENNTSSWVGGGLCFANAVALVQDCVITGNSAAETGGGVVVFGHSIDGSTDSWVVLDRCTITDNSAATSGAAVRVTNSEFQNGNPAYGRARLTSCIVADHDDEGWLGVRELATLEIGCSDLYGNAGAEEMPAAVTDLGDNFWLDPLFCDGMGSARWELGAASPCLPGAHPDGADCGRVGARDAGCGR